MATLDEIGAMLFGTDSPSNQTTIFYATAMEASSNGEVRIQLDDPVYSLADEDTSDYEWVYLSESDDDAESIGGDDDQEEEEWETVWWTDEDDDATEGDE